MTRITCSGPPEGELPLAEAGRLPGDRAQVEPRLRGAGARRSTRRASTRRKPVPLHIRNAPTPLMKELGYGQGYQYAHDVPEAYIPQEYLPDALEGPTLLRARPVRLREGDREAAGVVGGARRRSARRRAVGGDDGGSNRGREERDEEDRWLRPSARWSLTTACAALGTAAFKEPVVTLKDVQDHGARVSRRLARRGAERLQSEQLSARRDAPDLQAAWSTRITVRRPASYDSRFTVAGRATRPTVSPSARLHVRRRRRRPGDS